MSGSSETTYSQDLLTEVAALARKAGEAILQVYAHEFEVISKQDHSPLTVADLRSHEIIAAGLRALTPQIPIVCEEASDIPFEERREWARFWLVDPLDGTREFVSRNGEFTVNIALIDGHEPVLGVVHVPVSGVVYSSVRGLGAFRDAGRGPEPIHVRTPAATPLRVTGSRSHRGDSLDRYLPRLEPCVFVAVGSSIKFCLIAEGAADLYPRFGPTSEWDTAAAQAVLEAAGGAVVRLDGEPLRYNTGPGWLNPHFIAYGDRSRDWLRTFEG